MRRSTLSALFVALLFTTLLSARCQSPEKVSVCALQEEPATYNHKLISVEGFVSHDFEDFTIFDPACRHLSIWLEYGGTRKSDTMYCCGVAAGKRRQKLLTVENIEIPLTQNSVFKQFDREIQAPFRSGDFGSVVHATLIGRFFAGTPLKIGGVTRAGYGHMGCCSLLAIQEIASVDPQNRDDLDYGASADQPDMAADGCGGYEYLTPIFPGHEVIEMQQQAESDVASASFDRPETVARAYLASREKLANPDSLVLKVQRKANGRIVYDAVDSSTGTRYVIVMSRPYLLAFHARDSRRIAWVPLAVIKLTSCE